MSDPVSGPLPLPRTTAQKAATPPDQTPPENAPADQSPNTPRKHPAVRRFYSAEPDADGRADADNPPIVFMHVPKTGGTYLLQVLTHNLMLRDRPHLYYCAHQRTAAEATAMYGPNRRLAIVLRDPVDRFVSAYNSRLAEGRPGYVVPWSPEETRLFTKFPDIHAYARGLVSPLPKRRAAAALGFRQVGMLGRGYLKLFGTLDGVRADLPKLALCLPMDQIDPRMDAIMESLGMGDYDLPDKPFANRGTPQKPLNLLERTALRRLLRDEYAAYDLLVSRGQALHS